MRKGGISAIVATVLIILITVAAVAIIWLAVIPMIQQSGDVSYNADIVIETEGGYTYFDSSRGVVCVQVKRSLVVLI